MQIKGQIIKLTAGVYTVEDESKRLWICKARGVFRNQNITPYVGDYVLITPNLEDSSKEDTATITNILDRKNFLIRPPVANIDYMVVVSSTKEPLPNYLILDKFFATMEYHDINTILAVTKPDLSSCEELVSIYTKAGYQVFVINNETGEGSEEIKKHLNGALCVFSGNTGTGKSSLLNSLDEGMDVATGEISQKLGRGRHTTRHVEIFSLDSGLRVADTPGFSSIDITQTSEISAEGLAHCFIDFKPFADKCKFNDCSHRTELGCEVIEAVKLGQISESRYNSYLQIYEEIKDVKQWERR